MDTVAGMMDEREWPLYGERGVVAYDELADRIQCHVCGTWFQKLTSFHLRTHTLTIPLYKELCGLNEKTALETPRLTRLRRAYAARYDAGQHLVRPPKGRAPSAGRRYPRRAQYVREHATPEKLAERARAARAWGDEEMLAALRRLQAEVGGYLRTSHLKARRGEGYPSEAAVRARFGSWAAVCDLLGQPRSSAGPAWDRKSTPAWTDEEIVAWLCALRRECGGRLTAARLRRHRSGGRQRVFPSYETIYNRFGSWAHVCRLMDLHDARADQAG